MGTVRVERTDAGYVARNGRGGEISIGDSTSGADFTPVELLLAAVGGCNIVSVEPLTAKRGHRLVRLAMTVEGEKVATNLLGPVTVTYDVELPEGDDKAEEVFKAVAQRVHERACTVSRTLSEGTPVTVTT
ncbi:OsmC family protein [Stackebrandtia nassauensis]|uniref:OsmC family protein n=1 Tax=Stackebrandtia nassauensis (strain DSM 44728 / CIP 108903 / NRRL B-16338 / NBRC 102104 / LLR-40K-21) TaxID=446470 RepID=D3Q7A0_STANL|nr:OsmC family protein [Stackebrandtia nassauensis]ADD42371.1 OsmC family protein [Stackebrandtia nassauensis DSM 44728]